MLKRLAAVMTVGMVGGMLALAGPAQAANDTEVFTNEVISAPDNHCPTWARDSFTRTTEITESAVPGTYDIYQHIAGTFTTTGTPTITGTIAGFVRYTVTGTLKSDFAGIDGEAVDLSGLACKDQNSPDATGNWALRFFENGATKTTISDWEYSYGTPCKTFTEPDDGTVGAVTFDLCPVQPDEPSVRPYDCATDGKSGELAIPDQAGVVYSHTSGPVADGDYIVTATAATGYVIDGEHEWTLTVKKVDACTTPALPDTSGVSALPMLLGGGALLLLVGVATLGFARRRRPASRR